jgi:hypothetical protein
MNTCAASCNVLTKKQFIFLGGKTQYICKCCAHSEDEISLCKEGNWYGGTHHVTELHIIELPWLHSEDKVETTLW